MFWGIKNKISSIIGWDKWVQKTGWMEKNSIVDYAGRKGYSYIGDSIGDCGAVNFSYNTMFELQRLNAEAQQSKNLISKMVWKLWVQFKGGNEVIDSSLREKRILSLFSDPYTGSFRSLKDKYYTNHFCSGMIFSNIAKNWLGEPVVQILDSRWINLRFDKYGNTTKVLYNNKEIPLNRVVSQVTQYDPDKQWYGMSAYESVVYDALSDREASKRNFYFFKNNAMPSVILTLDDEIENQEEIAAAIKQFEDKYKGTEKSHGVLASWGIKEVRTIDFSNKDLELLELKKFAIKKMWVIFWFDPRFLGYKDDANGSHAEYQVMANQSDKSMTSFADILEEYMFKVTMKVYPSFPFSGIELVNDQFLDIAQKQELILKKVEKGLCTLKQGIKELWYSTKDVPEEMDTYILNTQWNSIENILWKSKLEQEKIWVEIEWAWDNSDDTVETDEEEEADEE